MRRQLCLLDLNSSCHSQLVSGLILSFESRLISERTHAESGPASDGLLTNHLSIEDKQELPGLIEDYRQGLVPLIVPLTLLKHHLNRYPVPDWVHQQVYLHPYPKELMLRNHV